MCNHLGYAGKLVSLAEQGVRPPWFCRHEKSSHSGCYLADCLLRSYQINKCKQVRNLLMCQMHTMRAGLIYRVEEYRLKGGTAESFLVYFFILT